jgi:hypothetical protein
MYLVFAFIAIINESFDSGMRNFESILVNSAWDISIHPNLPSGVPERALSY